MSIDSLIELLPGFFIIGLIVSALKPTRSITQLSRSQFTSRFGLTALFVSIGVWLWYFLPPKTSTQWYIVIAISAAFILVGGYVFGVLLQGRALNVFGKRWLAILGFIPLVSFIMFLKSGRNKREPLPPLFLEGRLGVAIGLFAIVAARIVLKLMSQNI